MIRVIVYYISLKNHRCHGCSHMLHMSAGPGLRQGRGGAWDHRRCGTSIRHSGHRHLLLRSKRCSLPFAPISLHSPLLLGRSSLPFASRKTPKSPKTLQIPRGCLHPALRPQAFFVRALQSNPSRLLAPSTPATSICC